MHLQLIKNAQVQPWVVQPAEPVSFWQRCSCECTPFLMAAGVDDPPDLGLNFKRKFRADVFYNLFMAKQKKQQKLWKQNMRNMSCSRRRVTKHFGFGFLAATSGNLWFMIISVTLWKHSTGKDRQRVEHRFDSGIGHCCFVNTQYESQHLAARTWRISKGSNKLASAKNMKQRKSVKNF